MSFSRHSPQRPLPYRHLAHKVRAWYALAKRYVARMLPDSVGRLGGIGPHAGTSSGFGKAETVAFVEAETPDRKTRFLDVGPGRGTYRTLLRQRGYLRMDAVEIYGPYIEAFGLRDLYDHVYAEDIRTFAYTWYDVVIFGDVLEHLTASDAARVVDFARSHSGLIIAAVPYLRPQIGSQLDGSGDHRQPDLTRAVFIERYPGFSLLVDDDETGVFYCRTTARPPVP